MDANDFFNKNDIKDLTKFAEGAAGMAKMLQKKVKQANSEMSKEDAEKVSKAWNEAGGDDKIKELTDRIEQINNTFKGL